MNHKHEVLVESTRQGWVSGDEAIECQHFGSVAVVDTSGRLVFAIGDPDFVTFTRSTIKPFQALPLVLDGGAERFGFGPAELALTCASHSGESVHVATVAGMLERAGQSEAQLRCGCHVPLRFGATGTWPAPGEQFGPIEHNCSGKHAGFLAWCVLQGQPLESYLDPGHRLQATIRDRLVEACGVPPGSMRSGIDGCSAPNHAIPLSCLARGYARLAQGGRGGGPLATALGRLADAMLGQPELVSGTGRTDLALMRAAPGDWIAKVGAEGVQALGIRSAGVGIAVKIIDGNARAAVVAALGVLEHLGLMTEAARQSLAELARPPIRNARGTLTGTVRPAFRLRGSTGAAERTLARHSGVGRLSGETQQ